VTTTTTTTAPASEPRASTGSTRRTSGGDPLARMLRWRTVLLTICALLLTIAMLLPLVWMLLTSVKPESEIVAFPPRLLPHSFTFQHYVDVWSRIPFARLYLNTIVFAGSVTLVSLLFDSMTAYALARLNFRGRNVVFIAILIMLMLPFQVTLVPLYDLLSNLGWTNTLHGLIVPRATNAFGIFFLRQFFLSLPKDLEEAARVDGAGEFRIYRQIVMPLALPALLTLGLFHFMYNWNDLLWPLLINQDPARQTLPAGLAQFMGQHVVEYGLLMAASVMALMPVIVFFLLIQRRFVEGVATTGIK
jgi:multiple sugar transport system permease protein